MGGLDYWILIICPLLAIVGHNYSIFTTYRDETGRLRVRGGAGGGTCMGGAFALWPPSVLIILPVSMGILFGLGYASVATMSMAFSAIVVFALRAWSLRPNIKRLAAGNERLVGWRAKRQRKLEQQHNSA